MSPTSLTYTESLSKIYVALVTLALCYCSREVKPVCQPILQAFDFLCRPSCVKTIFRTNSFTCCLRLLDISDVEGYTNTLLPIFTSHRLQQSFQGLWSLKVFVEDPELICSIFSGYISGCVGFLFGNHYSLWRFFCSALLQRSPYDFEDIDTLCTSYSHVIFCKYLGFAILYEATILCSWA